MLNNPLVTIGIPTYNRANYLHEAIRSAINQTYKNIEVIISDNASTDTTSEIVDLFIKDSRVRYYRHKENMGQVKNWNYCLEQARGEYFVMLSDDDILESKAVEILLSKFTSSKIKIVYCQYLYIDEFSKSIRLSKLSPNEESGEQFIISSLKCEREVMPSAMMHRTIDALINKGFPDIGTTTDLASRLLIASNESKIIFYPSPLVKYRIHIQSLTCAFDKVVVSYNSFLEWARLNNNPLSKYCNLLNRFYYKSILSIVIQLIINNDRESLKNVIQLVSINELLKKLIIFSSKFKFVRHLLKIVFNLKKKGSNISS